MQVSHLNVAFFVRKNTGHVHQNNLNKRDMIGPINESTFGKAARVKHATWVTETTESEGSYSR